MKFLVPLLILIFCSLQNMEAQENNQKSSDLRIGLASSFMGSGDFWAHSLSVEFNQTLNPYFTYSLGLSSGRSDHQFLTTASFFQANTNLYWSLFKNNRRNDFRMGTGLSYAWFSDAAIHTKRSEGGQVMVAFEPRSSLGLNLIVENTFALTDRFLLGLKVFSQPYFNEDINTGIMLKFGVRL